MSSGYEPDVSRFTPPISRILTHCKGNDQMPNIYEQAQELLKEDFEGKPAHLEYLPTQRSRKWRKSSLSVTHFNTVNHCNHARQIAIQENWFQFRWVEGF